MTRTLLQAVRALAGRTARPGTSRAEQKRIVSMVDAGYSYGTIRRELGVGNGAIDGALRRKDDGDRAILLHP